MSQENSYYDPMSLHPDADAIATSPEVKQLHDTLKIINQEEKYARKGKTITVEVLKGGQVSELFGELSPKPQTETPQIPLNNDAAAEDEITVVENS